MRASILGRIWSLVFRRIPDNQEARGLCQPPWKRAKKIVVDSRLTGLERLEVIIHELIHAAFWWLDESVVAAAAYDIAKIIWDLGYRLPEDTSQNAF